MARLVWFSALVLSVDGKRHPRNPNKRHARGHVRRATNEYIPTATYSDEERANVPAKLDWTSAITEIKDQGPCGSCWAYSAVAGIESALYMATGHLESLSTEQVIACDTYDGACDGGDTPTAFKYVKDTGGIDLARSYPDTSNDWDWYYYHYYHHEGHCHTEPCKPHKNVVQVEEYGWAIPNCDEWGDKCEHQDEDLLKAALARYGPLSICVTCSDDWDDYDRGIMDKTCSAAVDDSDHCVQLVGYDTSVDKPYWKIRNSWGDDWGERGFIRLPYGRNACGLADYAMYVNVSMARVEVV